MSGVLILLRQELSFTGSFRPNKLQICYALSIPWAEAVGARGDPGLVNVLLSLWYAAQFMKKTEQSLQTVMTEVAALPNS